MYLNSTYCVPTGRRYEQGDHVEFFPRVQRRGHAQGEGGLEGSATSSRLGTINMFYTFGFGSRESQTFVELADLPIVERISSRLFVTDHIDRSEARLDGFSRVVSGATSIIFIDSIVYRIKLVPHFTDDNRMCALRMWEAR
jgi:hypothetical protein